MMEHQKKEKFRWGQFSRLFWLGFAAWSRIRDPGLMWGETLEFLKVSQRIKSLTWMNCSVDTPKFLDNGMGLSHMGNFCAAKHWGQAQGRGGISFVSRRIRRRPRQPSLPVLVFSHSSLAQMDPVHGLRCLLFCPLHAQNGNSEIAGVHGSPLIKCSRLATLQYCKTKQ